MLAWAMVIRAPHRATQLSGQRLRANLLIIEQGPLSTLICLTCVLAEHCVQGVLIKWFGKVLFVEVKNSEYTQVFWSAVFLAECPLNTNCVNYVWV